MSLFSPYSACTGTSSNRRQLQVQRIDADGQIAKHVFIDRQLALHLLDRRRGRIDGQQGIVTLAVLLDAVGEVAKPPIFDLGDVTAEGFDQGLHFFIEGLGLDGRDVLTRDQHVLVSWHVFLLPL
jgi:hypothetical protein